MKLRVIEPGLWTLVVDGGRPHTRRHGVPVGGPADRESFQLGNALVGNAPEAAALELTLLGPILRADDDLAGVIFGAPFEITVGGRSVRPGTTFTLRAGEHLRVGGTPIGARGYLCVRGGLRTPEILGSRSAFRPVAAGDDLECLPGTIAGRWFLMNKTENPDPVPRRLRVLPGLQADWFEPTAREAFRSGEFTVQPASDRMGLRLDGPLITAPSRELVSEPVCPGAVQVTRDGRCIVLGVDCQTIGGYPKIAQAIDADLDLLGRLRPGETIGFREVDLAEAEDLGRRRRDLLRDWMMRLRTAEIRPAP